MHQSPIPFKRLLSKSISELDYYSVRRYYVDLFMFETISGLLTGNKVIDLGGVKNNRRGIVNINELISGRNIVYDCANISSKDLPEFECDITSVPAPSESYDKVILTEVLEHVFNPFDVLKESHRLLTRGGSVAICTPYFFHTHPDPKDYARYSPDWYQETLSLVGFKDIQVVPQGTIFMVFLNLIKLLCYEAEKHQKLRNTFLKIAKKCFLKVSCKVFFYLDEKFKNSQIPIIKYSTTGFSVTATK